MIVTDVSFVICFEKAVASSANRLSWAVRAEVKQTAVV